MATPSPDPLDPLFARWRDDTPKLTRSLTPEVWSRIDREESGLVARTWRAKLELAFSRPAFAVAFMVGCVLLGLFLAETRLSDAHVRRTAELERSYLRLLDPRIETVHATIAPAAHRP